MQSFNREDYIHRLEEDNERLKQIILGNEMEITAKDETIDQLHKENEDLKNQVRGYLINFADTDLMKALKDCIIQNKKLSSQEQNQLSAWVECAMDFGNNLDECSTKLDEAKEIIRDINEGLDKLYLRGLKSNQIAYIERLQDKAEQFLKECE